MTEGKEHATSLDNLKDTISNNAIGIRVLEVRVLSGGPHRDFACSSSGRAFDKQIGVLFFQHHVYVDRELNLVHLMFQRQPAMVCT